jgi:hypothetical protein
VLAILENIEGCSYAGYAIFHYVNIPAKLLIQRPEEAGGGGGGVA